MEAEVALPSDNKVFQLLVFHWYVCMYVCMYLYKSFFNMFRPINVAIMRGSRLVKNMKHFQGKGKTYILEYDILVRIGQSCGKYEMYWILYIL